MVETDWREILSFSQRELGQTDKEKLCEGLSWMEADDIELNFTDLKTLFRLAQDILKYKSEQVNNLMGKLESSNRKIKRKSKSLHTGSPASTDSALESIAHQEEVINANKEILKQLCSDIADLEAKKSELEGKDNLKEDSDSSRDALSEMDAVVQLENEVSMKNRHIRKLLNDVNVLEDENASLKEKVTVLKDKLLEATQLIDNLTEQILCINNEYSQLKEILGETEKSKVQFACEIESLRKKLFEKDSSRENIYTEIKSKVQHWKNVARAKKAEIEALSIENVKLKESLYHVSKQIPSPKRLKKEKSHQPNQEQETIKELQEKLIEASNEMEQSANLINILKAENRQLKSVIEDTPDHTITETKNESDDGKQRLLINKLKKRVKSLTVTLRGTEEMVAIRERELAEIASELQLLQSNEGINTLLQGLKHKKNELKIKDEGIKSLVQEVNSMSQLFNELQLENETLRQKYNVPPEEIISTTRIVNKYRNIEQCNAELCREIKRLENNLVNVELDNRNLNTKFVTLLKLLNSLGYHKRKIEEILHTNDNSDDMPLDGGGESSTILSKRERTTENVILQEHNSTNEDDEEMKRLAEENEGLRKGLQEILDFLKDNSTTSSGILALQCPSLEALLRSMEARHAAGWFAPHMATVMELRAALGGKDALLSALHDARKETFDIMHELSKETKRSSELEQKVKELETVNKNQEPDNSLRPAKTFEFGTWMSEHDHNSIDMNNKSEIEEMINKGNEIYETQLKMSLEYFHGKFKTLYDRMTSMAIQAADDSNKWSLQEEQYRAQIESLKGQIQHQDDEDISDNSPGIISIPSVTNLQRKCKYLEESYRYIRTLNENIKNETMDVKRQIMTTCSEYEAEIQRLILSVANLTDKLRCSIPLELFWKQNFAYNEIVSKYRKVLAERIDNGTADLMERLDKDKLDVIRIFHKQSSPKGKKEKEAEMLSSIEETVLRKQVEGLCKEIGIKSKKIEFLENRNAELQAAQSAIIDNSLATITKEEEEFLRIQLKHQTDENKILKKQCQHVGSQLDIALLQLQEHQQKQMSNDMEINLLRHQILDLQSNSDNKAIVARLSGEVLVAHLQASESNKKIEILNSALAKEKELRIEAEVIFKARQQIFDVYSFRYESKFRYMFEVMQVLRQQYQGCIPLLSVENYLNAVEDVARESRVLSEKLQDIDDLRSNLMAKHSVFDQILDVSKQNCLIDQNTCSHKLNAIVTESLHSRELEHIKKKLQNSEQSREDLIKHCNSLEKTLILVNQGFENTYQYKITERKQSMGEINATLELEDVQSDDDTSRKSQTITLPKPQVLKPQKLKGEQRNNGNKNPHQGAKSEDVISSPSKPFTNVSNVLIQTISVEPNLCTVSTQTSDYKEIIKWKNNLESLIREKEKSDKELSEALTLIQQKNKENLILKTENINLETTVQNLRANSNHKDKIIEQLHSDIDELKSELFNIKSVQSTKTLKEKDTINTDTKHLLQTLKQLENDKNVITSEYKELLKNEREQYAKTIKELNMKMKEMKMAMDRKETDSNGLEAMNNNEALKQTVNDYTLKIIDLKDKSFKFRSELDECKSEVAKYKSEIDRWKELASERLVKMEQLNSRLDEKHCSEIDSYKAESAHWMKQLDSSMREQNELRLQMMQQKATYIKNLADKDALIEQLRSAIKSMKTKGKDVESTSDAGSDKLKIKYDSSGASSSDESAKMDLHKRALKQPDIEQLRRDKQMVGQQNELLRRQVKALAAKEKRSRIDAENLKNQVMKIRNNSENKRKILPCPDTQTLQKKVESLEAQLLICRARSQSSSDLKKAKQKGGSATKATPEVSALQKQIKTLEANLEIAKGDQQMHYAQWDKFKRAQKTAERWQARFEEKCKEVQKLEASIQTARTAIGRLEKEKRILMTRITELKDKKTPPSPIPVPITTESNQTQDMPSHRALLDRVEAQQRKIVALQYAEKGSEHLVSAHEKALAEITSLRGQVLKLESALLEAQIRSPISAKSKDAQPELEYLKCYCEMLKEENVQLTHRVSSLDSVPNTATAHQNRINDLEQTILILRGLVSKLQADLKAANASQKRSDSRPNSGRNTTEKTIAKMESSHRIEIANLKKTIQDKDLLLERSKEMLKMAAEREDELLRENSMLRHELEDLRRDQKGYGSA